MPEFWDILENFVMVSSVENFSKCPHSYYRPFCTKIHQGTCSCGSRCRFTAKCACRRRSNRCRSCCTLFNTHTHTPRTVFRTNHCSIFEIHGHLKKNHFPSSCNASHFNFALAALPCFYIFFLRLLSNT